jgi:hypothetical protein
MSDYILATEVSDTRYCGSVIDERLKMEGSASPMAEEMQSPTMVRMWECTRILRQAPEPDRVG